MSTTNTLAGDARANALAMQLPRIPQDQEGPVFREPWEARAFAMTVQLHEQGLFTWAEWADTLSTTLKAAEREHGPDDGSHYYHHWLAALETLMARHHLSTPQDVHKRHEDWRRSALETPHGQPIVLKVS